MTHQDTHNDDGIHINYPSLADTPYSSLDERVSACEEALDVVASETDWMCELCGGVEVHFRECPDCPE